MIPTVLLTGFLGSGKTTLLNRLIIHYNSKRTVLLINEFGKVGIDGELLVHGNYDKIELNKGSLFCICVRTDFIAEVEKIATQLKPELLIIETTGLADTSEMENMLALPNLRDKIQLSACICLVDCPNFLKIKDNLRVPTTQVKSADLVLVNKIDLAPEKQIAEVINAIKTISPQVTILKTEFAKFPMEYLEHLRHPQISTDGDLGEGRPDPVTSITLEGKGSFTQQSWDVFKTTIESNIMRIKGFVTIDNRYYYVDATIDRCSIHPRDNQNAGKNLLVVIGQNLDERLVENNFGQSICTVVSEK